MSTLAVAKKDFLDVWRSRVVWSVSVLYISIVALFLYSEQNRGPNPDVETALLNLIDIGAMFIPLVALVSAYLAIAGERESSSIKYLLSVPNTRRQVVLGKYLSRASMVTISVICAFLVGGGLALNWYSTLDTEMFVGIAALTLLYTLTYVAIAIGISASAASRSRAMAGAVGFFFVTNVLNLFGPLERGIRFFLNDLAGLGVPDFGIKFMQVLISPTAAYLVATPVAFPGKSVPPQYPWYLQGEVVIAILCAWLIVPVVIGIRLFKRADLD
ncbi:ABC transporter permease subunit [Natrinema halophilum]|uniref:ABC transporter permease n=1 Tax=Natrinema halophilum TaxID=1699371 RepID=A0A7D5KRJ8_9EURY|nr:ABC transporter permease subunit [Natrinema halophilum]QLG49397.1 ABC transporter permease [Natrinema halophilum]